MRRSGIALILTVGILMLLSLAGVGMLGLAGQLRIGMSLRLEQAQAGLLARSGIEYASARLAQDSAPRNPATAGNQADDWTCRDDAGVPLEVSRNPSYAQGDPYTDLPENGRYDLGGDPYRDLNGNGRFDAWSGRLRGALGMAGDCFYLRIAGSGGKVGVNGGAIDAGDRNGDGLSDYNQLGSPGAGTAAGPGLYWDLSENGRVADLISTLAEVLTSPAAPGPASRSKAGQRIVGARPLGGYRHLREIQRVLGAADWSLLKDHLTLRFGGIVQGVVAGDDDFVRARRGLTVHSKTVFYRPERRRPVSLASADVPLLEALFRHLTAPVRLVRRFVPPKDDNFIMHLNAASITPPDALAVAEFLARRRPLASGYQLYLELDRNKAALFPSAAQQFAEAQASTYEVGLAVRFLPTLTEIQNRMADLVFTNAQLDSGEAREDQARHCWVPPLSWASYDVERQGVPSAPARVERDIKKIDLWKFRTARGSGVWSLQSGDTTIPFGTAELLLEDRDTLFDLKSLGRVANGRGERLASETLLGAFQSFTRVVARTQDDFENAGRGKAWGLPEKVTMEGKPVKDRTQTYPLYPRDSCPDLSGHPDFHDGSPYCGDIRLMDFSGGEAYPDLGCVFYAPMWEEGQPYRVPHVSGGLMENFRDVVGGAVPGGWGVPPDGDWTTQDEWVARSLLQSGTTAVSYFGSGYRFDNGAVIPGSLFPAGGYAWGVLGRNADDFPIAVNGTVEQGTIEFWSAQGRIDQSNPLLMNFTVNDTVQMSTRVSVAGLAQADGSLVSPGFYSQPDWHHIAAVFDREGISLHVDGIVIGLDLSYYSRSVDSTRSQAWLLDLFRKSNYVHQSLGHDELRFYRKPLPENRLRIHASRSRFWVAEPTADRPELRIPPSYASPLYRFAAPARIDSVHWEGFVPKLVKETAGEGVASDPLQVDLLVYLDGVERTIRLPRSMWLFGGGTVRLDVRAGAFRYKVWMDVSGVDRFNNETPVFDSISVGFRSGKLLEIAWE